MKIAIVADSHFNLWRKNNSFFEYLVNFFNFLIDESNKRKIEYLVFAGDLFHTKSVVSAEMLLKTTGIFKILNKRCKYLEKIFMIPGNHDIYLRRDASWNILHIYNEFPKVEVFHELGSVTIDKYNTKLWFLPFMRSSKEYRNEINKIHISNTHKNILFSHIGVHGFKLLQTEEITIAEQNEFITKDIFNKFDHVFLGHLHGYQTQENITYVSSPIQSRHGDEYAEHGFVVYDMNKNTHEFIENIKTPRFSTIKFSPQNIRKLLELDGENKFIRLVLNEHIPSSKLSSIIEKLNSKKYYVDIRFNLKNSIDYDDSIASIKNWDELVFNSTEELFKQYLDYVVDIDLDKDELYKFVTNLKIDKEDKSSDI